MKKFYCLVFVTMIYAGGIVWASFQPGDNLRQWIGWLAALSSLLHIPAYAGLSALIMATARTHNRWGCVPGWKIGLAAVLFSVLFGIMNEYLQASVPGRAFSVLDMILNALGALIGLGFKKGARHLFLRRLFFLMVLAGMAAVPARFSHAADLTRAPVDHFAAITERITRLQARYGISFKYEGFPPKPDYLKFSEVSDRDYPLLAEYLSLFEEEITQYPPGFFKDQDIRGIGLVMRLFSGEMPAQGMFHHQARVMFFEISRFRKNKAQQRHSIHHEIFHMMVQQKGGSFAALGEDAWETLNHPDFVYGEQTKPLNEPNPYNRHAPNQLGFVTYYAMESAVEDQAEIFACLMLAQHRRLIEQWMVNDPFLAKKVHVIKDFARYYHPDMLKR